MDDRKPRLADCRITAHDEVAPGQFRLTLEAPDIAHGAKPGQFCMVEVAPGYYPFLRRPMCFERILPEGITILYKVEGEGTRLLSRFDVGKSVNIQGPLGNGWPIDTDYARHIIVSGGIGVVPFPSLAEILVQAHGIVPEVILAARTQHLILCEQEFRDLGCPVYVVTDDGSAGEKLYAAQMLEKLAPGPRDIVYACGPMIMMMTCSEVARRAGATCLVSLEAQMACGDGVCLGCVVASKREKEGEKMVRVCVDGPIFNTTLIDWQAHNTAYDV